ncbi:helix-turn-helix transcriptional regulator [Agrococcus sediminis]|uniref:helix-turn-helix transcriptional regulator n=1 Tax=Agrococcus TaxID=46352 RepID=UPI000FE35B03|nr:WYL domain-containing protein [Agrococcus sp. BE272]MDR7234714.1 proteasome accessory factor C [Agrococcus sp. BE272]RWR24326.1 WYL domain-containing protein [Agrococcus lahaulensis]
MSAARVERGIGLLLSLIQYVSASGSATVAEAAAHFGVDEERIREAVQRVFMAGVPDGAGDFIRFDIDFDAFEEQDVISVTMRPAFEDETVRLSPREASALIAGLTLVAGYTDASPERVEALRAKLRRAASRGADTVAVDALGAPRLAQQVRDAIRRRQVLELDYRKPDEGSSRRRVAPTRLELREGQVYVEGVDLDREAMRTFRLDRIERLEPADDAWPDALPAHERHVTGTAQVVATRAAAAMLADYAASAPVSIDGERVRLDIEVWSEASVLRAVAACGGDAEIVAPPSLRAAMHRFAEAALGAAAEAADGR